jgi:hypothetical protein
MKMKPLELYSLLQPRGHDSWSIRVEQRSSTEEICSVRSQEEMIFVSCSWNANLSRYTFI